MCTWYYLAFADVEQLHCTSSCCVHAWRSTIPTALINIPLHASCQPASATFTAHWCGCSFLKLWVVHNHNTQSEQFSVQCPVTHNTTARTQLNIPRQHQVSGFSIHEQRCTALWFCKNCKHPLPSILSRLRRCSHMPMHDSSPASSCNLQLICRLRHGSARQCLLGLQIITRPSLPGRNLVQWFLFGGPARSHGTVPRAWAGQPASPAGAIPGHCGTGNLKMPVTRPA